MPPVSCNAYRAVRAILTGGAGRAVLAPAQRGSRPGKLRGLWRGRLSSPLSVPGLAARHTGYRADRRCNCQPQSNGDQHRRLVADGMNPEVLEDNACEDHQDPGAYEEERPSRHQLEKVTQREHLLAGTISPAGLARPAVTARSRGPGRATIGDPDLFALPSVVARPFRGASP